MLFRSVHRNQRVSGSDPIASDAQQIFAAEFGANLPKGTHRGLANGGLGEIGVGLVAELGERCERHQPLTSLRPRSNRSAASSTSLRPRSNISLLASTTSLPVSATASLPCCVFSEINWRVSLPLLGAIRTATAAPMTTPVKNHASVLVPSSCVILLPP